ncbi:Glycerol dehydrogenase [Aedoeadaptatus ivorii]|uniref:Glycerol dehydrogenase n=1 Tax=Aedoeadaptatus ivorii TaxID=54006 RepID=A0A3S5BWP0_9FIRM|nr:iron-containing alcohol dehydrogenase family protein [Peptoniphilus ivorii]VEJ36322.1 Glycerol dehydrogenase [Peptoniphilus ivorii]
MFLPAYSVSRGGYDDLAAVIDRAHYTRVALIGGERALTAAAPKIREAVRASGAEVVAEVVYGTECSQENIDRLANDDAVRAADVLFAVGGGKAIDTVKVLSLALDLPVFAFPTICSNCAAMTAIAVVYHPDGSLSHYAFPHAPRHVFIDLETIANAPDIYFWAGIGDGISKQAEVTFAARGEALDHTARLGLGIAQTCEAPLIEYAEAGLQDVKAHRVSRAVEEVALDILVSTGYVSNLTNQDAYYYNSSLAHVFFDTSCSVVREGSYLHGEVVAFGVMVLHAYDDNATGLEKIARFNRSLGLPVTLAEIGLSESDLDGMMALAPETIEFQRARTPLSADRLKEAAIRADAFGRTLL